MKQFEYMRVAVNRADEDISNTENQLNLIGNDGWKAFHTHLEPSERSTYHTMQIEYWYFKREKQQ